MFCTKCGKEYVVGQKFCMGCGNPLGDAPIAPTPVMPTSVAPTPKNKKPLIIAIIVAFAVILIGCVVAAVLLLGNGKKKNTKIEDDERIEKEIEDKEEEPEETEVVEEPQEEVTEDTETTEEETQDVPVIDESEWKTAYYDYIQSSNDLQSIYESDKDEVSFYLIYIDDNDVPELYMDSLNGYIGDMVATYNGSVDAMMYIGPYGSCEYVERSGQFANSDGRMGYYSDTIYSIENGVITYVGIGSWNEVIDPETSDLSYEYIWNGDTKTEEEYYELKKSSYPYERSRYCNSTSNAMTFDELLAFLSGQEYVAEETTSASFQAFYLDPLVYYYYDLDGDGVDEEIYYEIYTDFEDYYGCELIVYVNGNMFIDRYSEYSIYGTVTLCDFDFNDNYKEIYLNFTSESDCFDMATAYHYVYGSLEEYFSIDSATANVGRWSLNLENMGSGYVCYDKEYYKQYLGQGYGQIYYSVVDGALEQLPTQIYNTTPDWQTSEYHALIEMPLYADIDADEPYNSIHSGDCFHVYMLCTDSETSSLSDDIVAIYVITDDGRAGWLYIPNEEFFEENSWRCWG